MSFAANRRRDVFQEPVGFNAPRWYAVYTYPRHEKAVAKHLEDAWVEAFLPIFKSRSRWKDRSVEISRPLFPGYVFTRITMGDRSKVMSIPSVVRILSFNGRPAEIPSQEIESVRLCVEYGATLEAHPIPEVGERARVCAGVFEGVEGIVLNRKNKCKVIISLSLIHQAVALEIDSKYLEPVRSASSAFQLPEHVPRN
jgi:transcription antitermination factor NusG